MNSLSTKERVVLTENGTEEEISKVIDRIRTGDLAKDLLIDLLSERHPVYEERPSYQMNRIRGYAMASFAEAGLPNSARNFVLEELQSGRNAYMVAAAARGLRGTKYPGAQYIRFLFQALSNIRYHDDSMDLSIFKPTWPLRNPSSAKKEIFLTFQWLQGYAKGALPELRSFLKNTYDFDPQTRELIQVTIDIIEKDNRRLDLSCCDIEGEEEKAFSWLWWSNRNVRSIGHLEVQNQVGTYQILDSFIGYKPTVVTFFYTRCMNPNKCTLTINKMGWLQKELIRYEMHEKVNLLAFTYDPNYDTPTKMHVFGENRGMDFGPNVHMLRTKPEDFSILSDFFKLGVNHVSSTVNQHRLELFLLNQNGSIETSYARLHWEVEKVVGDIRQMFENSSRLGWLTSVTSSIQQVLFPLLLAFFPKCPICWAVYLSAFGVSGLQRIPYSPWLIPWIILAIALNLIILFWKARVRNGLTPFWISLAGGVLVLGPGYLLPNQFSSILGVILILTGALFNSLTYRQWSKLTHFISLALKRLKRVLVGLPSLIGFDHRHSHSQ